MVCKKKKLNYCSEKKLKSVNQSTDSWRLNEVIKLRLEWGFKKKN